MPRHSAAVSSPGKTLKKTLEKVLAKVRRRRTRSQQGAPSTPEATPAVTPHGATVTGRTIFGDRPLRFRRMTLPDPDMPSLDDPSNFESAFKIRIAHLTHTRRDAQVLVERQYAGR